MVVVEVLTICVDVDVATVVVAVVVVTVVVVVVEEYTPRLYSGNLTTPHCDPFVDPMQNATRLDETATRKFIPLDPNVAAIERKGAVV